MRNFEKGIADLAESRFDRLVAVEPGRSGTATLFVRSEKGEILTEEISFCPWLLIAGPDLAGSVQGVDRVVPLKGARVFDHRVVFGDCGAYFRAVKDLKRETGLNPTSPKAPYRIFSDLTQQFMSMSPARLFRGMSFAELHRLQLDIETLTTEGYDFPNPEREGDRIIIISMRDSRGWERCLSGVEMDEEEILRTMVDLIRERDPDVIEGHNLFKFDLQYIAARARRHRVKLALGRDGSTVKFRSSRFTAGERRSSYRRADIHGRHVVDTYHLVQLYDVIHRDLKSYGLKAVARHFGVAAKDRTYVAGEKISEVFRSDPDRLLAYAMDDVRETDAISQLLSPSYFYQTQLVPFSFQNCVTRGTASRIDALLTAAYMVAGASLPRSRPGRTFRGGLTKSLRSGVFENVWHVDVRSLYPSIIIAGEMCPESDSLGIFHEFLSDLRRFRLEAKDALRSCRAEERAHVEALQSSFKVLINSFYGYVGFFQATFNDYDLAEAVTAEGRRILRTMLDFLEAEEATPIEMDTDGIYFVPPAGVSDTDEILDKLQGELPEGIDVDLDATYRAMFSYKSKNYALLDHDGSVSITGAGLKSRGVEPFQRRYILEFITLLLEGENEAAADLYDEFSRAIEEHRLPLADFAKREVLSTAPATYSKKLSDGKGRRSAAYELVLKSDREYRQGDQVTFYVTGNKKSVTVWEASKLLADAGPETRDENVPYYLSKLKRLRKKFAEFIGE